MRSETKIFNEWYFKKYGGIIPIGTMTGAVLKSWVRKGFDAGWNHRQTEVDELQKENAALVHVIKSRDIQLENEKHEYDELMNKLVDSRMKNKELQRRLDAVKQLIEEYRDPPTEDKTFQHALSIVAYELEQALKGVEE